MRDEYVNISIPKKLGKAVNDFIEKYPELDLRSRAEVVKFALRKLYLDTEKSIFLSKDKKDPQ